ncbi:MAG: hypothetical protein JW884_13475 [Deltaproteobacteria bacterium]|nr:hypothetical protein [Deltaproteobacteria bacterium]
MEQWLLIVETNCKDKSRETEFDAWYDTIHIPDILEGSPGFKKVARYINRNPLPGQGKYLAIYEIETTDIDATMKSHQENVEAKYALGRKSQILEVVSRRICKVK